MKYTKGFRINQEDIKEILSEEKAINCYTYCQAPRGTMSLPNEKLREIIFQFLFCHDFIEGDQIETVKTLMHLHKISKKNARLAYEKMEQIQGKLGEIDQKIALYSKEYALDRICRSEKNLLRLSIYELLHDPQIPEKVAISEGIRLARKFSTKESSSFVNAVLDSIYQNECKEKAAL